MSSQQQSSNVQLTKEEYIKLIEDERAKYAEAKKTIAKLVNKLQNDQETLQQERVDNREKIATLQSIYQSKIEDLLEQLQHHKDAREVEQKGRLEMLQELANELSNLEKENEATKHQLAEERAANSQLLLAMQEEVTNVQTQMETMRSEINANENTRRANDSNNRKLNSIEASIKQVMDYCIKEMEVQVRRSLEDISFYSEREKLQAQIDEERKSRNFILMMDQEELKNILDKEQVVLREENEKLEQEEKRKTEMGLRVRHMLDCHSSTKRELESIVQKREESEKLLAQLRNEAKNLEEMTTNMLSTTPPSDSFDSDSSKDDSTDSFASGKWSYGSVEMINESSQPAPSSAPQPTSASDLLNAELARQMNMPLTSLYPSSPPPPTVLGTGSPSLSTSPPASPTVRSRNRNTMRPPSPPASTHAPPTPVIRTVSRTLSSRSSPTLVTNPKSFAPIADSSPPAPLRDPRTPSSPRSSPRSFTSAMKNIFQKDKDKERDKEKDEKAEKPITVSHDSHENSNSHESEATESNKDSLPLVNHALLAAQNAKRGASWAATPSPPLGFGSSTSLPILKPRARSNLATTSATSEVHSLKAKFEAPSSPAESPPIHPRTVPTVSLMTKLGLTKTSWPDENDAVNSPRSPRMAEGAVLPDGTTIEEGLVRRRANSVNNSPRKDSQTIVPSPSLPSLSLSSQSDQGVIARRRSGITVTIPERSSSPPRASASSMAPQTQETGGPKTPLGHTGGQKTPIGHHTVDTPTFPLPQDPMQSPTQALPKSQSVTQLAELASKDRPEVSHDAIQNRVALRTSRSAPHVQGKSEKSRMSIKDKHRSIARAFNLGGKINDDFVEIHSAVEDHIWNIKIDNETTAKSLCTKLSQKLDSNFDNFELHLYVGKIKRVLNGHERIIEVKSKLGKDWPKCSLKLNYRLRGSTSSFVALPSPPDLGSPTELSPVSSPSSISPVPSPPFNSPVVISPPVTPDPPSPPRKSRQRTVSSPNTIARNEAERRALRRQSTHSDVPSSSDGSVPASRRDSMRSPLQYFFSKNDASIKKPSLSDIFAPAEHHSPPTLHPLPSSPDGLSSFSPSKLSQSQSTYTDSDQSTPNSPESSSAFSAFPRTHSSPLASRADSQLPIRKRSLSNAEEHQRAAQLATESAKASSESPAHTPQLEYFIKIESLVYPERDGWKVRLDKPTTVNQVCKKMSSILGKHCNSFELYELQGSNKRLLAGEQLVQDVVAAWGPNTKRFGLLYVETSEKLESIDTKKFGEYIVVQSLLEASTWRQRLEPNMTVEDVCNRLSKKIDEKYKFVELYVIGSKEPLPKEKSMAEVLQNLQTNERNFGLLYKVDASDNDARFSLSHSQIKPGEIVDDSPRHDANFSIRDHEGGNSSADLMDSDILRKLPALPSRPSIIIEVLRYIWITCDNSVYIYDREKTALANVVKTPGLIMTVQLCGRKIWAGFLDGSLRVYNRKGRLDHELPLEFQSEVTALAFTGRHVWSAADMNLCIWDKNYKSVKKFNTGNYIYCMLVVGPIMWVGTESSIQRWDISSVKHMDTLKFPDVPRIVSSMVLVDREIWSTSSDSRVAVWNAETGQAVKMITTPGDVFTVSFGGNSIWMGTTDGIAVYDKLTKDLLRHISSPQAAKTRCLCETKVSDKWFVWSGNVHGDVCIWRSDFDKSSAANKAANKKKQIVTSSWQQLFTILSDINLLGITGDAQEVFDAITVLDKQISNL